MVQKTVYLFVANEKKMDLAMGGKKIGMSDTERKHKTRSRKKGVKKSMYGFSTQK